MPQKTTIKVPTIESLQKTATNATKHYFQEQGLSKCPECNHLLNRKAHEIADSAARKHFKNKGYCRCPECGRLVDTLIISNLRTRCPFCMHLNWLDLVSVVSKTPEGMQKTVAISGHIKDPEHKENNMIVKSGGQSILFRILNILTFGLVKKRYRFGYVKFYVTPALLKKASDFDEKYLVVLGVTSKELVSKYFGNVALTVKKQVEGEEAVTTEENK